MEKRTGKRKICKLDNKGAALLWVILFTVILTILLGAVMTSTYTYYAYTTKTVRKQQAYFTCRSALDLILNDISQESKTDNTSSKLLPGYSKESPNQSVTIKNVDFGTHMGKMTKATIVRTKEDTAEVAITSEYQGVSQTLKATIVDQPIYFGGIAVDDIESQGNGTLELADNTDIYYVGGHSLNTDGTYNYDGYRPAKALNTQYLKTIGGNLIARGDININAGSKIAGHTFNKSATLSKTASTGSKVIWNSNEFILSNKEIQLIGNVQPDVWKSFFKNKEFVYCNNNNPNVYYWNTQNLFAKIFGEMSQAMSTQVNLLNAMLDKAGIPNEYFHFNTLGMTGADCELTGFATNQTKTYYLQVWSAYSLCKDMTEHCDEVLAELDAAMAAAASSSSSNWLANLWNKTGKQIEYYAWKLVITTAKNVFAGLTNLTSSLGWLKTILDVKYIDYKSSGLSTYSDRELTPIINLMCAQGTTTRIKYGYNPNDLDPTFLNMVKNWFNRVTRTETAYTNVYIDEGATVELGPDGASSNPGGGKGMDFYMSFYGGKGSTLILNDGVVVHGSIYVDKLIVKNGNAKVIYSNSTGSQVAKQRIDSYWTVSRYADSNAA